MSGMIHIMFSLVLSLVYTDTVTTLQLYDKRDDFDFPIANCPFMRYIQSASAMAFPFLKC